MPSWKEGISRDYDMQLQASVRLERLDEKDRPIHRIRSESELAALYEREPLPTGGITAGKDDLALLPENKPVGRPETTEESKRRKKRAGKEREQSAERERMELEGIMRGDVEVPNPEPTKATKRWQDIEKEKAEYYRNAPTREISADLLDEIMRVQAAADRSKNLRGDYVRLFKNTVASIRGALVELAERASGANTDARLDELFDEVKKLKEDNQRLQDRYDRLYSSYQDKEARECIRTGTTLESIQTRGKTTEKRKNEPQRTSLPLESGEAQSDPGKETPSRPRPSADGEKLGGKRELRDPLPPRGGRSLKKRKMETAGNNQMTFNEKDFPKLGRKKIQKNQGNKPKITSNVMVVAPKETAKDDELRRLEKDKAQTERSLETIEKRIRELKLSGSSASFSGKNGGPSSFSSTPESSDKKPQVEGKEKNKKKRGKNVLTQEDAPKEKET